MVDSAHARYARHSRWSDPGGFGALLDQLPCEPSLLPEIVGGLVLHPLFAAPGGPPSPEPTLRRMTEILTAILGKSTKPLGEPRTPEKRVLGTCRNYALLACAILRQHGTPARLRKGFADYFTPDFWEDHWVCEYHDGSAWRLLDAELTEEVRERFSITFNPADVPREHFISAGPAWLALRREEHDPARFGVSAFSLSGLWFPAGSLFRDVAALTMEEMMAWDYWGPARNFRRDKPVPTEWLDPLDALATGLAGEPSGYEDARAVLNAHSWAALTPMILSFPDGNPVEVNLGAIP